MLRSSLQSPRSSRRMAAITSTMTREDLRVKTDSIQDERHLYTVGSLGVELYCSMSELVGPCLYSCYKCRNHVSLHDDIISKAFQGRHGRAFLFSHAMNIVVGAKEDRNLMTGLHTVADISCGDCNEVLGWKYERAYDPSQKYKEGKFIFEKSKIVKENW